MKRCKSSVQHFYAGIGAGHIRFHHPLSLLRGECFQRHTCHNWALAGDNAPKYLLRYTEMTVLQPPIVIRDRAWTQNKLHEPHSCHLLVLTATRKLMSAFETEPQHYRPVSKVAK